MKKLFPFCALGLFLFSCGGDSTEKEKVVIKDSVKQITSSNTDAVGIVGIQDVPEQLCLVVKDSAVLEEIPLKMGKAYATIEEDAKALNVEMSGSPGVLFYNNDPKNFVFECVIPISRMPASKPKKSNIVVLEATKALVCNYYGSYDKIYQAYESLKQYISKEKLTQIAPAREFYITDPQTEPDSSKWLSKIYVPVK